LGDNVVEQSTNMAWYSGPTLMELLESAPIGGSLADAPLRMAVQSVIRPMSERFHDYRGYAGRVASGVLRVGDEVTVYPSERHSRVRAINLGERQLSEAQAGESVAVQLADDIDIGRGDLIAGGKAPQVSGEIKVQVCWFNANPLLVGNRYIIRHATREVQGIVRSIDYRIDIETLTQEPATRLDMNDIAALTLKTSAPLVFDPYSENRTTGSLIFIDPATFETVGAGMII
jgi:sulfate adenylyltransferase subunit 1